MLGRVEATDTERADLFPDEPPNIRKQPEFVAAASLRGLSDAELPASGGV